MRKLITIQDNKDILNITPIPTDSDSIKTFILEDVPEILNVDGKIGEYAYNPISNNLDIVYTDIPLSDVDKIRIESAQANAELFEMMISMLGGI